jgi:hypothetical protein
MPSIIEELANALRVELDASRRLGEEAWHRFRLSGARIDGIEATQTIQYYRSDQHLTDPATRGMDNAVVLAAYKPAWVRTYLSAGVIGPVPGVTGTLTVERRRVGFVWSPVSTLAPQPPGSIDAQPSPDYATQRGSTANTLNFIVPAADCYGVLRLTVELTDAAGRHLDRSSVVVHATLKQTLRLRAILIAYNGPSTATPPPGGPPPNLTLAAPTLGNLQATASRALRAMPVQSTGSFAVAGTITFTQPLDDARSGPGGCSTNWGTLLGQLAMQRTNDGNRADVVYYGLLPAGMPVNVPGCGNDGLGAGRSGDPVTLLHEIGHGYGFDHTPCNVGGTTDPNYPDYKPYPAISIGEYGLDVSNGTVFSPQATRDFMSYCFPQWMSLYQHERLVGHARLDPSWIIDTPIAEQYARWRDYVVPDYIPDPPGDPWQVAQRRPDPVISIIGVVRSDDEVEVTSVARVRAVSTPPGEPTALRARLVDADGRELARAPLHELAPQGGCGCRGGARHTGEPPYLFQALLPDVAPGAALTIGVAGRTLWERRAPATPPAIRDVHAEAADRGRLRLAWDADVAGDVSDAWVQWSDREGRVWHGLAAGLTGRELEVSTAGLPAGPVLLRVLVHDGFHTAVSDPVAVELPPRPPEGAILTPEDGATLPAGGAMRLWAAATDSAGAPLPEESCLWLLDAAEVGRGTDVWVQAPPPGEHRATLIVRAEGEEARHTARFTTIGAREG